jgi:hypothetical protein
MAAETSTGLPAATFSRTTGTSHLGIRSEDSAHNRAKVSRTAGLAKRAMNWCL